MIRLWLAFLLAFIAASASARAEDVLVRTRLDPADKAVIGQPVDLVVEVLFPGEMPHPPRVSVADAPGAQILRFETQAVTLREQVGATSYVGQRFTFVVFPRRGDRLVIPAAQVTLLDRNGDPAGAAQGVAQSLDVDVPSGIDASGPVLAAEEVTLTQSWNPLPGTTRLRPGAALVRTIQRKAQGVPALGMADFSFGAPAGVRVYLDPPQSEDHVNRGDVEGSRTDRVTYVFEKAGSYDLPPLVQSWWDMRNRQARQLTAAGIQVDVAAAASANARARPSFWTTRAIAAAISIALVVVAGLAWFARAGLAWRKHHAASAAAAQQEVRRRAAAGQARESYQALEIWLSRLPPPVAIAAREHAALGPAIARLEAYLFGNAPSWTVEEGAYLARSVRAFSPSPSRRHHSEAILPPLNAAPGSF
ncbi:hypothetical protein ACMDCR_03075 [Labrys okinawensis]|uniref:hypothetical protein n=1 Tax=Labrys okinawensis TaxID=346911 RepID=UPI0039BD5BF4